jgi:hypothetical protein
MNTNVKYAWRESSFPEFEGGTSYYATSFTINSPGRDGGKLYFSSSVTFASLEKALLFDTPNAAYRALANGAQGLASSTVLSLVKVKVIDAPQRVLMAVVA